MEAQVQGPAYRLQVMVEPGGSYWVVKAEGRVLVTQSYVPSQVYDADRTLPWCLSRNGTDPMKPPFQWCGRRPQSP
jgi:hypothetical protein